MNSKYLWAVGALALAAGGLWFGRAAWRAHHHLVSLNLHEVPLAEALRQVERQTGEKIELGTNLDTRITLKVSDRLLAYVLDRLAEQAGARWVAVHAVYDTTRSLPPLESALRAGRKPEDAGWLKLAPTELPITVADDGQPHQVRLLGPGQVPPGLLSNLPPGAVITTSDEVAVRNGKGASAGGAAVARQRGPMTLHVMKRAGPGGTITEEEAWSPEELVIESALNGRLSSDRPTDASAAAAAETARKVKGHWRTYYVLRKSRLGGSFAGLPNFNSKSGGGIRMSTSGPGGHMTTNGQPFNMGQLQANLEDAVRLHRNDELGRLTPEQRVQRARERQGVSQTVTN